MNTSCRTGKEAKVSSGHPKTQEVSKNHTANRETFFSGVMVLTISNLLVKALGMLFKIPMNYIMGDTGMGYYNAAYTIYTFFYMLSTAGLPAAVSIMVSASRAVGKLKQSKRILHIALLLFCIIGILGTAALLLFPDELAGIIGAPPASVCIIAVAPTLFFVCIASVLRGYFQGCSRMAPTAVSQLLEAFCKVAAGILCALYAIRSGFPHHTVAAYAVLGLTLGSGISMLYLIITGLYSRNDTGTLPESGVTEGNRVILSRLASIAVPITISSAVMSLTGMIDAVLIQRLLQQNGLSQEAATTLYGNYTSLAVPMFNLPPVLVYPIAYALVPLLTRYRAEGHTGMEKSRQRISSALRIAVIIGAPCALGLSVLSEPILALLYRSSSAAAAAPLLTILAPSSLLVCVLAITNSVLQSIGKARLPVYSMLAGAGVKILTTMLFIPEIGITAAPVSTFLCYLTVTVMNLFFTMRHAEIRLNARTAFFGPLLAAVVCSVCARTVFKLLTLCVSDRIAVLPAVAAAVPVYFLLIGKLDVLQPEDLELLPKGGKLQKILKIQNRKNTLS